MKKFVLFCSVCALLASCTVKESAEYKSLQAENDSLKLVQAKASAELDDMLSLLNEVEDNFQSIKTAENYLTVQSAASGELSPNMRQRIKNDMTLITETLNKNKNQIAQLEQQLKSSGIQSTQMKKTLARLQQELTDKTNALLAIQEQLAAKDLQIAELSASIASLSTDVQQLQVQTDEQASVITKQAEELNTKFYCFGTSKELKDQKILIKGQLGTNFNKEYFTPIKNPAGFTEVPLFSKKAKLITKHPQETYSFEKDAEGQLELKISDTHQFWSLSKYLVVEVD